MRELLLRVFAGVNTGMFLIFVFTACSEAETRGEGIADGVTVQMGAGISEDGAIPQPLVRDDFRPGEKVFIAAKLEGREGETVTARWAGPNDLFIGTQTERVGPNGVVVFSRSETSAWPPGDYRVTVSRGARTIVAEEFHVIEGRGPLNSDL